MRLSAAAYFTDAVVTVGAAIYGPSHSLDRGAEPTRRHRLNGHLTVERQL